MHPDADDRFDPDQPPPGEPDPLDHRRHTNAYQRGAEACRAILRAHGIPDHGPLHPSRKKDTPHD